MRAIKSLLIAVSFLAASCTTGSPETLTASPETAVYKLASGDDLAITVYGEASLSGTYSVDGQGNISFPLLGEVNALGLSVAQLQQALASRLADGYVQEPKVSIEVANFRPYYILGEVSKAGEYAYVEGLTVYSAVARAGGFTYRANKDRIYIRHNGGANEILYKVDGNTPVMPGDTLRVPERFF